MTTLELTEWDEKIKVHLDFISAGAEVISRHVNLILGQPDFNTIAMHDLDILIIDLTTILRQLEKTKQEFSNKPVVR